MKKDQLISHYKHKFQEARKELLDMTHKYREVCYKLQEQSERKDIYNNQSNASIQTQPNIPLHERVQNAKEMRCLQEQLAQSREKVTKLKKKSEKTEKELLELKCLMKVFSEKDKEIHQIGIDSHSLLSELQKLGLTLNQIANKPIPKQKKKTKHVQPTWRCPYH